MDQSAHTDRRYDLDWLRVIAFGLLIFYHIGMFYVTWGWHVKSVHAGPWAEPAMMVLNPWRLPLLFLISGAALKFALAKRKPGVLFGQRLWRLGIPIVFGMLVIVAPQSWLQLREAGETDLGFFAFYPGYFNDSYSITTPTWNHLWYVVYILVYAAMVLAVAPLLRSLGAGPIGQWMSRLWTGRAGVVATLILPFIPHMVVRVCLDPHFETTHNLTSDWANHAHSFAWFLTGFWAAQSTTFWTAVRRAFPFALTGAIGLVVVLVPIWSVWDAYAESGANLWPARTGRVLYTWLAILSLLGFGIRFLNQPSRALTYMTKAVFPWYILHQTLIVVSGYYFTRTGLGPIEEFIAVTAVTVSGCLILYEGVIRRIPILRPLFGLPLRG